MKKPYTTFTAKQITDDFKSTRNTLHQKFPGIGLYLPAEVQLSQPYYHQLIGRIAEGRPSNMIIIYREDTLYIPDSDKVLISEKDYEQVKFNINNASIAYDRHKKIGPKISASLERVANIRVKDINPDISKDLGFSNLELAAKTYCIDMNPQEKARLNKEDCSINVSDLVTHISPEGLISILYVCDMRLKE